MHRQTGAGLLDFWTNTNINTTMTRTTIEETVKQFLIEEFEIDASKLTMAAKMKDDLGIDSLDVADIVVIVEEKFGFLIKAEEMANIITLNDFCTFIEQKTSK